LTVPRDPSGVRGDPSPHGFRQRLGRAGEDAAVDALRARGYRIVERNVRLRHGELDVVAEEAGDLVFVEVKARRSAAYGTPAEAVGPRKQRALVRLAAGYLTRRRLGERACRFDVVEVQVDPSGRVRAEILRDAFRP
jgi:putative endonuclease